MFSTKFREESMGKKRHMLLLSLFLAPVVALVLGSAVPGLCAAELSEAELFFELNDTDGDLGIHSSIDGGPYVRLEIKNPKGRTIFYVKARGRLARQGLTQLFFESAEPSFDELAPEVFFNRFPEGEYKIEARPRKGVKLEALVEISHVMAAPVEIISVGGLPAAEDCDAVPLPSVSDPVIIDWDPVTESHPEIGESGPVEIV